MGALSDLKVLELGGIGPVPFACMMLADLGAEIVRLDRRAETPQHLDPLMRGRSRFVADLRDEATRRAALSLVERAEVVVEGFRPGVTERLGLGPGDCLARNPGVVYARMTGWGQDGPLAQAPGHDINYIAITGALAAIGERGGPPSLPLNFVGDYAGGGAMLAYSIVAAVLESRRSGQGQVIDAAMVDGASYLMTKYHGFLSQGRWVEKRGSNFLDGGAPYYRLYETADGGYVAVGALEPQFYLALIRALGLDIDTIPDRDDEANWPALVEVLGSVFATRSRDEWAGLLEGTDACVSPVLSFTEATAHPHNVARESFTTDGILAAPRPAPRYGTTPARIQGPPGQPGEGDLAVLGRWGLQTEDIKLFAGN